MFLNGAFLVGERIGTKIAQKIAYIIYAINIDSPPDSYGLFQENFP